MPAAPRDNALPAAALAGNAKAYAAVAMAEGRLEAQLQGVRSVLLDAVGEVQREHEQAVQGLRNDNKRLHAALAQAHAREAEYEEKLARAMGAMSSLAGGFLPAKLGGTMGKPKVAFDRQA